MNVFITPYETIIRKHIYEAGFKSIYYYHGHINHWTDFNDEIWYWIRPRDTCRGRRFTKVFLDYSIIKNPDYESYIRTVFLPSMVSCESLILLIERKEEDQ